MPYTTARITLSFRARRRHRRFVRRVLTAYYPYATYTEEYGLFSSHFVVRARTDDAARIRAVFAQAGALR